MKKNNNTNLYDAFVKLSLLLLISTLLHSYSVLFHINDIVIAISFVILLLINLNKLKLSTLILLFLMIIINTVGILSTNNIYVAIDHLTHIDIVMLLTNSLCDKNIVDKLLLALKNNKRNVTIIVNISIMITIITLAFPRFYSYSTGEIVYDGLAGSHYVATGLCLCFILYLINISNEKFKIIHLFPIIVIVIALFETGARAFLLPTIILLFLYLKNTKIKNFKIIIISIMLLFGVLFFLNSSSFTRFISTSQNKYTSENKLEAMSSGRLIWWKYDLEAFNDSTLFNKVKGNGYELVTEVNRTRYGLNIWAHNDFIQILVSSGLFGLVVYFVSLIKPMKTFKNKKFMCSIIWIVYVIVSACVNGFYNYISLVYSSVFLYMYLSDIYEKNSAGGGIINENTYY